MDAYSHGSRPAGDGVMAIDLPQLVAGQLRVLLRPLTAIAEADDPVLALDRFVRSCGWSATDDLDPRR